ncbi:hypothetical protein [Maribacter sp. Hel_I_7]|uniref:hypothetical protein n=1 Tax=Maribacter sp. Hel_I_7 TaxID=1249997 RepID=UPI00047C52B1|nr:hypothetical protein [Maribacter sp. Hel_I_7]
MQLIDRKDLENWADTYDSMGYLPYLMLRLTRASTPNTTFVDIPFGSAVTVGGWDGVVKCSGCGNHVPDGISLWEFGTDSNVKGKAEKEYTKRTADPLGYDIGQSTFVFVTPRFWKFKEKWRQEKIAEKKWKDIRVYDSSDLAQWLDSTMAVARWFSSYIGKYPMDGIVTADEYWEEWSSGPAGILPPETVTSGRQKEMELLANFLNDRPAIKGVKASTKGEAIAFIIACAKQFDQPLNERFFSKTLLVDTEGNYRGIRINTTALNLIPRFEDTQPLYAAIAKGHHVLVPLGGDDSFNQDTIVLPTIEKDGQVASLIDMGLSREDAVKYSRESGRNITILKRLIGFPHLSAKWLNKEDIRDIVPALLLGRWNENHLGDRELLEQLSGQTYADYIKVIAYWRDIDESPIIQIGETWRLLSPLDAWTQLAPVLQEEDLKLLGQCFLQAFQNGNPDIEDANPLFSEVQYLSREKKFSGWAREGLIQSLILIAHFGKSLKIPQLAMPQDWVDGLLSQLLNDADGKLWISLDHELPLISEASPEVFLNSVDKSLSMDPPPIMEIFEEHEGFLYKNSNHTGLLWALEGLAWAPEYLYETTVLLLKLSKLDPGGNLSNRPTNSLAEIYKPWHYQTLADFSERMDVLKRAVFEEKELGWVLLLSMLPDSLGVAQPTHKMRWRLFAENVNLTYTYDEIFGTYSTVVDLLISIFDNSDDRLSELIKNSVKLSPPDRVKIIELANQSIADLKRNKFVTWDAIREILNHHRSYPETDWALPEEVLADYEALYKKLEPQNTVKKHLWLFNDHWPHFPEGFKDVNDAAVDRYKTQEIKIDEEREKGLMAILKELGIGKTLELASDVKEKWSFGKALAHITDNHGSVLTVLKLLKTGDFEEWFVHSYIYFKVHENGFEWLLEFYEQIKGDFSDEQLAHLFIPLDQSKELWEFIDNTNNELVEKYWVNMLPRFHNLSQKEKIYGTNRLIYFKRFFTIINSGHTIFEDIPSDLLVELLEKTALVKANEKVNFREYELSKIFEVLDARNDVEHQKLINLEWLYLPVLARYGAHRSPKILHKELSENPDFFIELLKWAYRPKDNDKTEAEAKDTSDPDIQERAKQAYQLLSSWKGIPGVETDGTIAKDKMLSWIDRVRDLAKKADRIEVADAKIGQSLAQYPETGIEWPPDEICEIIERINTDSLKRNFSSATSNKRSFSSRGAFEGGDIERDKAMYFEKLALRIKSKYPNVAAILQRLSKGYLIDAKRMDDRAERDKLEY